MLLRRSSHARTQRGCVRARRTSELQIAKIVVADINVVKGGLGFVVFDEIVLDAGLFGLHEDALPIDGALANVGEATLEGNRRPGGAAETARRIGIQDIVFYVNEREAAGVLVEIGERIFASNSDPAKIKLHGHELGIQFGQ